jgi:translation initiation factor 4E
MTSKIENFNLKNRWTLWFHKVNDNNWKIESYSKVFEITTYYELLFIKKELENITSGMFFLMKNDIVPIFEDENNVNGGYWSLRITKKEANDYWEKMLYYICIDGLTLSPEYEDKINGISISPKINNCIFKIWNSDYNFMKTEYLKKNMEGIHLEEAFYLQHNGD